MTRSIPTWMILQCPRDHWRMIQTLSGTADSGRCVGYSEHQLWMVQPTRRSEQLGAAPSDRTTRWDCTQSYQLRFSSEQLSVLCYQPSYPVAGLARFRLPHQTSNHLDQVRLSCKDQNSLLIVPASKAQAFSHAWVSSPVWWRIVFFGCFVTPWDVYTSSCLYGLRAFLLCYWSPGGFRWHRRKVVQRSSRKLARALGVTPAFYDVTRET